MRLNGSFVAELGLATTLIRIPLCGNLGCRTVDEARRRDDRAVSFHSDGVVSLVRHHGCVTLRCRYGDLGYEALLSEFEHALSWP